MTFMMLLQALCILTPILIVVGLILYATSPKWRGWVHDTIEDMKKTGEDFADTFRKN